MSNKQLFIEKSLQTIKDGSEILKTLTPKQVEILHSSHDLSEEVGELQNPLKKYVFYNQEIDRVNVVEELGDILCNVQKLLHHLDITEDEVYISSIAKISKRYPDGYNDADAKLRTDKEQ